MAHNAARRIHVKGIVQGVGFRPFVYSTAKELNLTGWVRNSSAGVDIVASGKSDDLNILIEIIKSQPPPLAKIDHIEWSEIQVEVFPDFQILESKVIPGEFIPISPDIAICEDCQRELFDPQDHRFRYPFINCTNCGPRLTIIKDIPYDRPKTTMATFPLCAVCEGEYADPTNRRFHAQPIACPDCGPMVWFQDKNGDRTLHEAGLQRARKSLKDGKIIAIKGLGGFHLACDATNPRALDNLRIRKKRSQKPFAVMAFSLSVIEKYCEVSASDKELIHSKQKPIVIVNQKIENTLPDQIAPGHHTIGVMLPYTPLHLLLLEPDIDYPDLLVMTSGNISEEPITYTNADCLDRLHNIADGFLLHDREIFTRVDDTVLVSMDSQPYFFRRSRGFAPQSITLPQNNNNDLSVGAELKNTFCLSKGTYAFISHHIGDLKNFETYQAFLEGVDHYSKIFKITPQRIACDMHPDYLSTKYANEYAAQHRLPLTLVQHHHAHLASCLADNQYDDDAPVIGMIFDGTGYGTDGNIWGGEVLIGNYKNYNRAFHLDEMPLPGGDQAVLHPYRIGIAYLIKSGLSLDERLALIHNTDSVELEILAKQIELQINTPMTTSMGRLFDAVASLIGLRQSINYEAQAAIELEQIIKPNIDQAYHFGLNSGTIEIKGLLEELISDIFEGIPVGVISAKFHNSVVRLVVEIASQIRSQEGIDQVALSGGVWQNLYLLNHAIQALRGEGFSVLFHQQVPANDGGISLGQAAILKKI
jgi:hydrogenase maturation protein HypF